MKRKTDNFSKFYNKKNNAAIKEAFRQDKKAAKKERREAIERRFEERRQAQNQPAPPAREIPSKGPKGKTQAPGQQAVNANNEHLPLNKYIAHGGICSRRDAAAEGARMSTELRALIFDVDGTLADTEEFHRRAFNAAFSAADLNWWWNRGTYRELLRVAGGRQRMRQGFPEPSETM